VLVVTTEAAGQGACLAGRGDDVAQSVDVRRAIAASEEPSAAAVVDDLIDRRG
jgi:hypothetical protein